MKNYTVYTDGSFGDDNTAHGGVVYWGENAPASFIHVKSERPEFVSMRNVGGEILAAWSAIVSIAGNIQKANETEMELYTLNLVYDYKGVGEWLTGRWKTNKPATQWFVKSVREILSKVPNLTVNYIWVKGHSGTEGNTYADLVANYDMAYVKAHAIPVCNLDAIIDL